MHITTQQLFSEPLSRMTSSNIYLKLESLQPSGSFKNRGIGHFCAEKAKLGANEFVCSSGGNAGLAASYAARLLGIPMTVFVPETTSPMMMEKIRAEGAKVVQKGADWQEADAEARKLVEQKGACYVPPFDDPLIWEGNATLIHEVAEWGMKPDAVVVSVGGGGLFCGILQGMQDVGWGEVPVFAVETEGAASFAAAIKAGHVVELEKVDTIAKSLAARAVTEKAVAWAKQRKVVSKVVSDAASAKACCAFAQDHRILVEPACGAALSLCYDKDEELLQHKNVLVIVCGGCDVTPQTIISWGLQFGE